MEEIHEQKREQTIIEICRFLAIDRDTLILNLDQESLDKYIKLWDDGKCMEIHHLGYKLKG